MSTETITQAVVTTNATIDLPAGSKMSETAPNVVVCPNGDMLKFWTTVELIATDFGPVEENLSAQQMHQMGIHMEHDETLITLVDTDVEVEDDIGEKTDDQLTPEQLQRQAKGSW